MHYLITGGTGYIGSHMAALLHQQGHRITILDNFSNSTPEALTRLQQLCRHELNFFNTNICDPVQLRIAFAESMAIEPIAAVLHFAGLKSVGESHQKAIAYYQTNVSGTLTLCDVMQEFKVWSLVFSSSATVYGTPEKLPVNELCKTGNTTNPYGSSKLMCEKLLQDIAFSHPCWRIAVLRYFNPAGAWEGGLIGEEPRGTPNNLLPYVFDVALGVRPKVNIFGDDYATADGTGERDYIHVMDLVEGHLAALQYLEKNPGLDVFNLGCGRAYSVKQVIQEVSSVCKKTIPFKIEPRRDGDLATVYADATKARQLLNWQARRDLTTMLQDQFAWSKKLHAAFTP